ncbi:hypothetical protein AGDE_14601 [Angomonas deanei]|nr:hypothetical protein AGDE_14601 [Angomonas deanei]|eukprot:EPY20563.1 hypothetical protein AGDE_14601 [Angomonas deanei]
MEDPPSYSYFFPPKPSFCDWVSEDSRRLKWDWLAEERMAGFHDGEDPLDEPLPSSSTYIAHLSGDPFAVGRVCILFTTGAPLILPLLPLSAPVSFADGSTLRWSGGVSVQWPTDTVQPRAELVVGELSSLLAFCSEDGEGSSAEGAGLVTSAFHSVPYKLVWRSRLRNSVVVSLTCEECLECITFPDTGSSTFQRNTAVKKRFQLPRGTVPLDVIETANYGFIIVGTYTHGALVCGTLPDGSIASIVRRVDLCGCASPFFPITHIIPLFPDSGYTGLNFLQQGVLVCSSSFETYSVVVKLNNGVADYALQTTCTCGTSPTFRVCDSAALIAESAGKFSQVTLGADKGSVCWGMSHPVVSYNAGRALDGANAAGCSACTSEPYIEIKTNFNGVYRRFWLAGVTSENVLVLLRGTRTLNALKPCTTVTLTPPTTTTLGDDEQRGPKNESTGIAVAMADDNCLAYAVSHHFNCVSLFSVRFKNTDKRLRDDKSDSSSNHE